MNNPLKNVVSLHYRGFMRGLNGGGLVWRRAISPFLLLLSMFACDSNYRIDCYECDLRINDEIIKWEVVCGFTPSEIKEYEFETGLKCRLK